MSKFLATISLAFFLCLTLNAQEKKPVSDTLEVYFHQGRYSWSPELKKNNERIEEFIKNFTEIQSKQTLQKITKIYIVAGCSPEGSLKYNRQLSRNRARSIRKVLNDRISLPDSLIVEEAVGVNWKALRNLVAEDPDVPYREEVLDIIDNDPELISDNKGNSIEWRKQLLIHCHEGKAWRYMYTHLFPYTRSFILRIVVEPRERLAPLPKLACPEDHLRHSGEDISCPPQSKTQEPEPHYFAIKTNLLHDALATPDIGVEFYLGRRFSIAAEWHYAWWKSDPIHWYHRTYGGNIEVRKYFGKKSKEKPLQGWHAGLYGQILTYDFEWGGRGYLADRWTYACGGSFGYSLPVRRRLNIDFNLGFGYMWGEFKEYLPIDDCYVWQVTKQRHWIGPTRFEISLVWQLGRGNVNEGKKGGRR